MNNTDLTHKIEGAKDASGVITASALHDQLHALSPSDWKEASLIYPKSNTSESGFYITDDARGEVTIHNDLTEARKIASSSVAQLCIKDSKDVLAAAAAVDAGLAGTAAFITVGVASMEGIGVMAVAGAGLTSAGATALVGGVIIGAGAVIGTGFDIAHNVNLRAAAAEDLRTSENLSFRP